MTGNGNAQNGAFGAPKAARFIGGKNDARGWGAWEIAARYITRIKARIADGLAIGGGAAAGAAL